MHQLVIDFPNWLTQSVFYRRIQRIKSYGKVQIPKFGYLPRKLDLHDYHRNTLHIRVPVTRSVTESEASPPIWSPAMVMRSPTPPAMWSYTLLMPTRIQMDLHYSKNTECIQFQHRSLSLRWHHLKHLSQHPPLVQHRCHPWLLSLRCGFRQSPNQRFRFVWANPMS